MKRCVFGLHAIITVNPHFLGAHKEHEKYWICNYHFKKCKPKTIQEMKELIKKKEMDWLIEQMNNNELEFLGG